MPLTNVTEGVMANGAPKGVIVDPTCVVAANVELGPVDHNLALSILAVTVGEVPVELKLKDVADKGLAAPLVTISMPKIKWLTSGLGDRDTFCVVVLAT